MVKFYLLLVSFISCLCLAHAFNVGVGIYDMTGPAAEINFMGYAVPGQRGSGIHLRLRARTYIISGDDSNSKRFAFVSVDGGMGSDLVKMKVVEKLQQELGSDTYTTENLSISGTHTHSGPGGFLQYVLYQVTSLGFVQETFDAWVNGITQSILQAHKNMQEASIQVTSGKLYDSNINRSPTSYLLNPESERLVYEEDGNTDKTMLQLEFTSLKTGAAMGVVNWFAVHGTAMNNTNTLISGDNRGYASYAFEKDINGKDSVAGMGPFVAAFASTNLGDVSPNTAGPRCIDTGLPCDGSTSTCNGRSEQCIAFGPGTNGDMFESTQIIGNKQYEFSKDLLVSGKKTTLSGPVDFRHSFVEMSKLNVTLSSGESSILCSPAMGYAFAAGTTDGPGMFGFSQGTTSGNPFWDKVRDVLSAPTDEEIACQAPKPILLNTADIDVPHEWDPSTVPLQIFRVGNFFIVSVPSEFTTMAGRRLRKAVTEVIRASDIIPADEEIFVTIAGLANSYSSYVTTFEEYQAQRYEAASTIFGPHTLEGYIQEYTRIMTDLVSNAETTTDLPPIDYYDAMIELMPPPRADKAPKNSSFGDVVDGKDVLSSYKAGDTAQAVFYSANPRNDQKVQSTFLTVEKLNLNGKTFTTVATDGDWETKFHWQAGVNDPLNLSLSPFSKATITWNIPADTSAGTYRLCHAGNHKVPVQGMILPYSGCSSKFTVVV